MIIIENISFKNAFATNTTDYLLAVKDEKITAEITIRAEWILRADSDNRLKFTSGVNSVEVVDEDGEPVVNAWRNAEFNTNDVVIFTGTTSNNVTKTITSFSLDGSIAYFNSTFGTTETSSAGVATGATPLTGVTFRANLIENNAPESYLSLIDGNEVRYNKADIDYTVTTFANLTHQGLFKSNELGAAKIKGTNVLNKFIIEHEFYITPFVEVDSADDIDNKIAPDYFADLSCLKYIYQVTLHQQLNDPNRVQISGSETFKLGNTGWFDENFNGDSPEYHLTSTVFKIDGDVVSKPDINKVTDFEILINSKNSRFSNNNTKFLLSHYYIPKSNTEFKNTPTNVRRNFVFDQALNTVGSAAVNGQGFGTAEQVLLTVYAEFISAAQIKITGKISLSSVYKNKLKEGSEFVLSVVTQSHSLQTEVADKVNVLSHLGSYQLDLSDSSIGDIDLKFIAYPYDDFSINPLNYAGHFVEDLMLSRIRFGVDISENARINNVSVKLFATHSTYGSFTLEQESFSFANSFLVNNTQVINLEQGKGYKLASGNVFNTVSLKRAADFDIGNIKKYDLLYPFKIRWEKFIFLSGVSTEFYNPSEPNNGFNNDWSRYFAASGWSLFFSAQTEINQNDVTNTFNNQVDLLALNYDDAEDWEAELTAKTEEDIEIEQIILSDQKTKLIAEFTKTTGFAPSIDNIEGMIEIEPKDSGGSFVIRNISTIRASETDSPFSDITKVKDDNKYTFTTIVDNKKLGQIFSNVDSFDVSARVYELPIPDNPGGWDFFIATWDTTKTSTGSSDSDQVRMPLVEGGTYDFVIDWGDGYVEAFKNGDVTFEDGICNVIHTYEDEGVYTITVRGIFRGFAFKNGQDKLKIHEIINWGVLRFTNTGEYFSGCANLTGSPSLSDTLKLDGVSSMLLAFFGCSSLVGFNLMNQWDVSSVSNLANCFTGCSIFNTNISAWDVSSVTNMTSTFNGCSAFNQPLAWNTSNVTNMASMFNGCSVFNQPLNWDVSSVTNMNAMFAFCSVFNQPLNWDVSNVTNMAFMFGVCTVFNRFLDWDVSSVTDMGAMFSNAAAFNEVLNWDVSNVTNMESMFEDAASFNIPLDWTVTSVTNMVKFFFGTAISKVNYDFFLTAITGWEVGAPTKTLNSNVTLGAQGINYSNIGDAADARNYLVTIKNWTINDAGGI